MIQIVIVPAVAGTFLSEPHHTLQSQKRSPPTIARRCTEATRRVRWALGSTRKATRYSVKGRLCPRCQESGADGAASACAFLPAVSAVVLLLWRALLSLLRDVRDEPVSDVFNVYEVVLSGNQSTMSFDDVSWVLSSRWFLLFLRYSVISRCVSEYFTACGWLSCVGVHKLSNMQR